jgi:hypothetical protein
MRWSAEVVQDLVMVDYDSGQTRRWTRGRRENRTVASEAQSPSGNT